VIGDGTTLPSRIFYIFVTTFSSIHRYPESMHASRRCESIVLFLYLYTQMPDTFQRLRMKITEHSIHRFGDITIQYLLEEESRQIGMCMYPTAMEDRRAVRRETLAGTPELSHMTMDIAQFRAWVVDPLVHVCLEGDRACGGWNSGMTMRHSSTTSSLKFKGQDTTLHGSAKRVLTTLESDVGLEVRHTLEWRDEDDGVRAWSELTNRGESDAVLHMVTSFNLGHLTPFAANDAPERLRVHRFRSFWSSEGRHEARRIEELHLEPSWAGFGLQSERFGQVGSMPVRKWFPFVALEDSEVDVLWGAQLAWSGSWQMEVSRLHDIVSLSGGLADRETGSWRKRLRPAESFTTPVATMSCVRGDIDDLCCRLTSMQHADADRHPSPEHDLPIVFNEWCTTWGEPTHDKLVQIADRLKGSKIRYLVIDAGWYGNPGDDWGGSRGDWEPNPERFPRGLKATCDAIRERGLVPGLWFELETLGVDSKAGEIEDLHLARDGAVIWSGGRRFWDLRKEGAHAYLEESVIDLLDECGFGYIKVDYNESIGLGADDEDSLGEGLRQCIEGTYRFFRRLRKRLPELVIENCSSGGHRLEPAMIGMTAMSSFSDAHESWNIPIVGANVQRLILPRQSQVWAVLHASDSERRTVYTLAATFLGRMCLSGEIWELTNEQMAWSRKAQDLYQESAEIIKYGLSRRYGPPVIAYRYPKGWQAIVREGSTEKRVLVVVHRFQDEVQDISCPLPKGDWKIAGSLQEESTTATVARGELRISGLEAFAGIVVILERS
jgi:alpha-galactosidase